MIYPTAVLSCCRACLLFILLSALCSCPAVGPILLFYCLAYIPVLLSTLSYRLPYPTALLSALPCFFYCCCYIVCPILHPTVGPILLSCCLPYVTALLSVFFYCPTLSYPILGCAE